VDEHETSIEGTRATALVARRPDATWVTLLGDLDDPSAAPTVARWISARAIPSDGGAVHLVADHPAEAEQPLPEAVASKLGLSPRRELLQLRRPLPAPPPPAGLPLRPFDPERDAEPWVRANNRAFADHPDQGAQTEGTLRATLAEPWVDLHGFLVADDPDRPGELAGSCWTKVHPPAGDDPALGEIFVIGVDPTHHGRGLGRRLVLAGLEHLADRGIATGMLYVEHDNAPARALYERLGFTVHLRRRLYLP
jgi:mycothiol synthase